MIVSRSNPKLKDIRRLLRCKGKNAILEGPDLLEAALDAGLEIGTVLATAEFLATDEARRFEQRLPRPPLLTRADLLNDLCDADSPKGILAATEIERTDVGALPLRRDGIYLLLDRIQDPGNLGAIARVAEAGGVAALALTPGCVHPNHSRALRASTGSLLRIPVAIDATVEDLDRRLQEIEPRLVALTPHEGVNLYETELEGTLLLAVGSEGAGLSQALIDRSDIRLRIPVRAPVESLNASVATGLAIFELMRRRPV